MGLGVPVLGGDKWKIFLPWNYGLVLWRYHRAVRRAEKGMLDRRQWNQGKYAYLLSQTNTKSWSENCLVAGNKEEV